MKKKENLKVSLIRTTEKSLVYNLSHNTKIQSSGVM